MSLLKKIVIASSLLVNVYFGSILFTGCVSTDGLFEPYSLEEEMKGYSLSEVIEDTSPNIESEEAKKERLAKIIAALEIMANTCDEMAARDYRAANK